MIRNLTKNSILCSNPVFARGFSMRTRGMIGRQFRDFDGMVFENCPAIHTCFMSMPIDAVFMDRENKVLMVKQTLRPWKLYVRCKGASVVIELPCGSIEQSFTESGDYLDLAAELTAEYSSRLTNRVFVGDKMETIASFGEEK